MIGQILRFGIVGTIGFIVDAGVLRLCLWALGLDPYWGRVVSFLAAAATTYGLNKGWTFRGTEPGRGRGLPLWLVLMGLTACVNYGAYVLSLDLFALVRTYPELGVAVGSLTAMGLNFVSARFIVFRAPPRMHQVK